MRNNAIIGLSVVLLAVVICGCGKKNPNLPDLIPVSGTVTLDGKPLAGATVYFTPVGETRGVDAFGKTDSDGRYTLGSRKMGTGTPVGQYKVTIGKTVNPDGSAAGGKAVDPDRAPRQARKEILPSKYSHPMSTILTATVEEGGGEIDFPLTTK